MKILAIVIPIVVCVFLASSFAAFAEPADSAAAVLEQIKANAPSAESANPIAQNENDYGAFRIEEEISRRALVLAVIVAAVVSLIIVLSFLKVVGTQDASKMVNASGLVLVVYATILVVMIAKAEQQLTAAIGILGAVAGYLFGSVSKSDSGAVAESRHKKPVMPR
jgi:hypothetical protein